MPTYTPWTWSLPHGRHYSYLMADDGSTILDTLWSGHPIPLPAGSTPDNTPRTVPDSTPVQPGSIINDVCELYTTTRGEEPTKPNGGGDTEEGEESERRRDSAQSRLGPPYPRTGIEVLPPEVQADIGYKPRRFIQTGGDANITEHLDSRYRRVARNFHAIFFVPGRVFKMLWTEPAGQANPGRTRNSTHFSTVWCGEQAYSEIRRFVVVRNKGTFSQCIPVQTYNRRGAVKPGLIMQDHGVIHTTPTAPHLMVGENLTKYSIRVESSGSEILEPESRVNYGKAYAVEHNVKVHDIGMVIEGHRYLIEMYFDSAMRGQ